MPGFLIAAKSGVHRVACLSLYRALLSQCSRLQLAGLDRNDVFQNFVRTRFRKHKNLQSPSQILNSLGAGYEALDLFHSCSEGNTESLTRLRALVQQTLELTKGVNERRTAQASVHRPEDRSIPALKRRAEARAKNRPENLRPRPGTESVLLRPRPRVSGIRHVPRMGCARGLAFLMIKKPQPMNLSRSLRGKLNTRWNQILRRDRLEYELTIAKLEDRWDEFTGQTEGRPWSSVVQVALCENAVTLKTKDERNAELAQKIWNIILRERKLADKEREERIKEKTRARARRRRAKVHTTKTESQGANSSPDENKEDVIETTS
ncbi:hypothetical protein AJ80_05266 [Polytolypa hystricis UAMH7299]|uniref:Complex 1 LYR protein domain-containing protein n=1 Tax=Polytolypa hystricis (strain UAMH7299) TaxID=1447883 RepID=A0A2B7Y5F6_POLH7|nr:hypothetical protein AJ80_05266 [Polytolypa hystricis UAMH7299]